MQRIPEDYIRETIALAEDALDQGEFPIAALLVLDDAIIARASTSEKRDGRFLVHAELKTLLHADNLKLSFAERRRAILFTNLEPCLMCMGAAMSFFLGKIHYSLESPGDGATGLIQNWERQEADFSSYQVPAIEGGLLRSDSIRLFEKFVANQPPSPMRDWAETLTNL
jgi:tRNA(adenine34) deaminase